MASEVDHCNGALAMIGAEAVVASIRPPDGSAEAGYCARYFDNCRRMLLEDQQYAFSKHRIYLVEVTNPSTVWTYAYAVPNQMINALRVLQLSFLAGLNFSVTPGSYLNYYLDWNVVDQLFTERGSADFDIETADDGTQVLLTNEPDAVLLYTADVLDTAKWSPLFGQALQMMLAGYLAGPILKGDEGLKIGMQMREEAFKLNARASGSNANSANERADFVAEHLRARA